MTGSDGVQVVTYRSGSDRVGAIVFFVLAAVGVVGVVGRSWWCLVEVLVFMAGAVLFLRHGITLTRTHLVSRVDFRKTVIPLTAIRDVYWAGLSGLVADTGGRPVVVMRLGGLRPDLRAATLRDAIMRRVEGARVRDGDPGPSPQRES